MGFCPFGEGAAKFNGRQNKSDAISETYHNRHLNPHFEEEF